MTADEIDTFWTASRHQTRTNPVPGYLGSYSGEALAPPAWAFGATPEQADELIALVLDGTKTATASAQWDYDHEDEQLPHVGDLSIVLDGAEHPRALIETTHVEVRPFEDVDAEHAHLEGEGDRSLEHWRAVHERFFTDHASHDRGFAASMPVVLERFRVLYPRCVPSRTSSQQYARWHIGVDVRQVARVGRVEIDYRELPELTGTHVTLRPLRADDAAGVLAAADDDAVFQWLPIRRPRTLEEAQANVDNYRARTDLIMWAQIDNASGQLAGVTTFYDIDPALRTVAIGHTWLGSRFWRTGINTEAKLLLLTHAFEALGCVRVVWHTDIYNERSQNAIARLGAKREGVLRKHRIRPDGSWRDTVTYSMTDDEWPVAQDALVTRLAR